MSHDPTLIFDGRWEGPNGIGRIAAEMRKRVFIRQRHRVPSFPASHLSPADPFVRGAELLISKKTLFFSPGFNAPIAAHERCVFTICDLIHLRVSDESGALKRMYYEYIVKRAVKRCFRILTISEYSRADILGWSDAEPAQVVNIGCGIDEIYFSPTAPYSLGYPYFIYVGARKPHKNLDRLLTAYATSLAAREVRLVLSGAPDAELIEHGIRLGILDRLVFAGRISDADLPAYYRGATALLFPSYFEGFGLPPVEAMAGGTPVLTSNVTSLPEAVGDAALMVDPYSIDAIRDGIDSLVFDADLRRRLSLLGPEQARRHSWDAVAIKVGAVLDELKDANRL